MALCVLIVLMFGCSALSAQATEQRQSTAPVIGATPVELPAPISGGQELRSSTAPAIGRPATPAPSPDQPGTRIQTQPSIQPREKEKPCP